jgi:hypothetical protein
MKNKKKVAVALLILLVFAAVAIPVFGAIQALQWEHAWDGKSVRVDLYGGGDEFYSYGYSGQQGIGGDTDVEWTKFVNCGGAGEGERVYVQAQAGGNVMVKGGCKVMTPTPAPTQEP